MMWRNMIVGLSLLLVVTPSFSVVTDELITVRSTQDFPSTMIELQEAIRLQNYTLSRVQRVDIGLQKSGFKTDSYRIVFFGRTAEIERLRLEYPQLIPYLPLKIVIFAEDEETLLVSLNPQQLMQMFPEPALQKIFARWQGDVVNILRRVQGAD